jgi:hypothetical protein
MQSGSQLGGLAGVTNTAKEQLDKLSKPVKMVECATTDQVCIDNSRKTAAELSTPEWSWIHGECERQRGVYRGALSMTPSSRLTWQRKVKFDRSLRRGAT